MVNRCRVRTDPHHEYRPECAAPYSIPDECLIAACTRSAISLLHNCRTLSSFTVPEAHKCLCDFPERSSEFCRVVIRLRGRVIAVVAHGQFHHAGNSSATAAVNQSAQSLFWDSYSLAFRSYQLSTGMPSE